MPGEVLLACPAIATVVPLQPAALRVLLVSDMSAEYIIWGWVLGRGKESLKENKKESRNAGKRVGNVGR